MGASDDAEVSPLPRDDESLRGSVDTRRRGKRKEAPDGDLGGETPRSAETTTLERVDKQWRARISRRRVASAEEVVAIVARLLVHVKRSGQMIVDGRARIFASVLWRRDNGGGRSRRLPEKEALEYDDGHGAYRFWLFGKHYSSRSTQRRRRQGPQLEEDARGGRRRKRRDERRCARRKQCAGARRHAANDAAHARGDGGPAQTRRRRRGTPGTTREAATKQEAASGSGPRRTSSGSTANPAVGLFFGDRRRRRRRTRRRKRSRTVRGHRPAARLSSGHHHAPAARRVLRADAGRRERDVRSRIFLHCIRMKLNCQRIPYDFKVS